LGEDDASKAFHVVIQAGAILAVVVNYRQILFEKLKTLGRGGELFFLKLFVGFLPAAVIGLLLGRWIKMHLFGVSPVAWALALGALLILGVEARANKTQGMETQEPTLRQSLIIGLAQCLALWPGMSRSMLTILAGRVVGLGPVSAASFSFFLALPTLGAATAYDLLKHRQELLASSQDILNLCVGFAVSFFVALLVIRYFLRFLETHTLKIFAWYRLLLAAILWIFVA
jgi:undecaprenyl-diphosphatase